MNVGDLVRLKDGMTQTWSDGVGLILAIESQLGWKDPQAFVYWASENKTWTFSVQHLEVISECR